MPLLSTHAANDLKKLRCKLITKMRRSRRYELSQPIREPWHRINNAVVDLSS
jgi:hypothetical protein